MKIETITINGKELAYKIVNGTAYREDTRNKVIEVLEYARINKKRIRVFYGDDNGRCWNEEFDTIGRIGRSYGGKISVPILLKNSNSGYGGSILTDKIVRITMNKANLYIHENFDTGVWDIKEEGNGFLVKNNGRGYANFKTEKQANKYVRFMLGEINSK